MLAATKVASGHDTVLPLPAERVTPRNGHGKQDYALNVNRLQQTISNPNAGKSGR